MRVERDRRVVTAIVLIALFAATGGAGAALAASPVKGRTYMGRIVVAAKPFHPRLSAPIRFKVSADGSRVGPFTFNYPVYCQGGGFGAFLSKSGEITKQGTFKVKLPIYSQNGSTQGFVIVTGSFAKHGKESGKVTTDLAPPWPSSCNGTSSYTTEA